MHDRDLGLRRFPGKVDFYVVEEEAVMTDPDASHRFDLTDHRFCIRPVDRAQCIDEIHAALFAPFAEKFKVPEFSGRIRVAPSPAVERIALRPVDVCIHPEIMEKVYEIQSLLQRVRASVETFDNTEDLMCHASIL